MTHKIGFIGYRNHAKKLLDIVDANKNFEVAKIFHPTKKIDDVRFTNNLDDLYVCDGIIIASPNSTHFEYIKKIIENSKCSIFCEKPPVTSKEGIQYLEKLSLENKGRILFNFNLRFSELKNYLEKYLNSDLLGSPIQINIIASMGLAFKEKYVKNWRSDGKFNMHNIIENVSIHWIDLMNHFFGEKDEMSYFPRLISKKGSSFDTSLLNIRFKNGVVASIFNSYSTPSIENITVIGTNGYMVCDDEKIEVFSPRDSFDGQGLFIKPERVIKNEFSFSKNGIESLKNSLNYFLACLENSKNFDVKEFETSVISNKVVLELKGDN